MYRIAVIGGGAAGCFCAVEIARHCPEASVTVLEAGRRPMAKLSLTGGGRCNYTNTFEAVSDLREVYPRGANLMKRALAAFSWRDTVEWFRGEGIDPCVQEDHCIFPMSNDALQVVSALWGRMRSLGVRLRCGVRVDGIVPKGDGGFDVRSGDNVWNFDAVVVTTGGGAVKMLPPDIRIEPPVPSLFTFRVPSLPRDLAGITVPSVRLSLAGTAFRSEGIMLLTDWGVSGPSVLRLSSYAARHMSETSYTGTLLVDWRPSVMASAASDPVAVDGKVSARGPSKSEDCGYFEDCLRSMITSGGQRLLGNVHPPRIPSRLWEFLLLKCGFRSDMRCSELGSKGFRRLCALLSCDDYPVAGRASFKEEFVTCGGVSLSEVDPRTMQSRRYPGLFFAGEVLDIDALTGGFNLQAAWSTARVAAGALGGLCCAKRG